MPSSDHSDHDLFARCLSSCFKLKHRGCTSTPAGRVQLRPSPCYPWISLPTNLGFSESIHIRYNLVHTSSNGRSDDLLAIPDKYYSVQTCEKHPLERRKCYGSPHLCPPSPSLCCSFFWAPCSFTFSRRASQLGAPDTGFLRDLQGGPSLAISSISLSRIPGSGLLNGRRPMVRTC